MNSTAMVESEARTRTWRVAPGTVMSTTIGPALGGEPAPMRSGDRLPRSLRQPDTSRRRWP